MTEQSTDYDSPWKEIIELYFPSFLEFFFPLAYAEIDWNRPYQFLDKELHQLEPDAEIGKRLVDKVAKVWLLNGEEAWVLVHLEVQGQYDSKFTERMYTYNYRLFDRHKKCVISLAVLADEDPNWRPSSYNYQLGGCRVSLEFPIAKLLDYEPSWLSLETSKNPFAIVVMAHLKSKATKRSPEDRLQWKLSLVRMLLESGLSRQDIRQLFRFIDWIMVLPEELAISFKTEIKSYEEARKMRYVTSIERLAKQEGIEEGLQEGRQLGVIQSSQDSVIEVLETRFGEVPITIIDAVNNINDSSVLKTLLKRAISIPSLAEFEQLLP
ncbi:transposase [Cuspidothrix issatschenkoi]|uniref:Transposase n=1 Tax=Cuspidothrix issatschenkoi CHARLIE-1 TaxID=2052836 RepID=A0A2S6CYF4_9CYAN|nr:transposase [Cuspidothrix issatschenkoi]PPJ64798.1 transposase [Cuspidothrix issatschenkoi CHARLIE-1]